MAALRRQTIFLVEDRLIEWLIDLWALQSSQAELIPFVGPLLAGFLIVTRTLPSQ